LITIPTGSQTPKPKQGAGGVENRVLSMWQKLASNAIGRKLFNLTLSRSVPYSGSIKANVTHLEPGFVNVILKDRRKIRNHLNSIHAIALANLGELASGLAMITALPSGTRSIVTNLEIEYLKKARGRLVAEGRASPPDVINESVDSLATADIMDEAGDLVACVTVLWRLSPKLDSEKSISKGVPDGN
jgi:acyl-coenzyme A thioesterase PaaI-like protein